LTFEDKLVTKFGQRDSKNEPTNRRTHSKLQDGGY